MANMSYCRFENTSGDLQDCIDALVDNKLHVGSGSREKNAAEEMYNQCETYIAEYTEWLERHNNDEDTDIF